MNRRGSRRAFLSATTAAAAGVAAAAAAKAGPSTTGAAATFLPVARPPDRVSAHVESDRLVLERISSEGWVRGGVRVETAALVDRLAVRVASAVPLRRVHLRWALAVPEGLRLLGDHWERGYGDLEWRGVVPERPMPWFFLAHDGRRTHGYGVRTGANALAHWQVDAEGVSLWLDVRCGGRGVELKGRTLEAATIVAREGGDGESAFAAARAFCALLHDRPRMPASPVYGGNSWYSAYDRIDADLVRAMTEDVVALSPGGENRPFAVIDSGWQASIGLHAAAGGPWREANRLFPAMPKLSDEIRSRGARPGIWIRPLVTVDRVPEGWTLPVSRFQGDYPGVVLDPSVPEVLALVREDVGRLAREWRYDLVKHDFTTYDLFGRWGFEMGPSVTPDGWSFADRTRTSAEIVRALYGAIREGAGPSMVIGCNTVGHLGAGLFELQRTGDDTSGREWERTRKMGVNTMAFRLPQHGTFFAADADCAPITKALPWRLAERWLRLVAASGTPLFLSHARDALGAEQEAAVREAFARAAVAQPPAEPLDWLETTCPRRWRLGGREVVFGWTDDGGVEAR
jgi:alpha-galactosidase